MSSTPLIDISPEQWKIVHDILQKHVPQYAVWAFGSRAKWTAKQFSDLDLAVISDKPLPVDVKSGLSEDFAESDLPWKVDVVDWAATSEAFRGIIERDRVLVQSLTRTHGWQRFRIGDLGEVVTGRTPPGTLAKFFGGEVPFVTPTDMDGRRKVSETARSLSRLGVQAMGKAIVPRGIAVSCIGWQMGKAILADGLFATNQQINTLVSNPALADELFIYYVLTNKRDAIFQLGAGGSRTPILNKTGFQNFEIDLPPLPEQKAIAAILGSLDDKIELNRRMNATLEAMARALFQSWFVDFDPVRAKMDGRAPVGMDAEPAALFPDSFEHLALGKIPKGWEVRGLDKTADYLNGLALQKYPPAGGPTLPVIKIAQLRKGDTSGADRCNMHLPQNYVVNDGDVLFSWSGSLEVELWCGGRGALNQHLFKVTSLEFPKWFYYLWTLHHLYEFRLIAAGKATTMGHIQRGHLDAAKTIIPPSPLLEAMTSIMTPLIEQIISARIQSRTLATLRNGLLPKLLSGELRVHGIKPFVETAI